MVEHQSYGSIKLTEKGNSLAREIYKKHTALVDFLNNILGVEIEIAEYDACSFEHYIHEKTYKKFKKLTTFFNKNPECLEALKNFLGED